MTSWDTSLPLGIALLVQSVTWSLGVTLPEKGHLYPWDDDDPWLRRFTTKDPYIIRRFTFSPNKYDFKPRSNATEPYVWLVVGGVILISLLALLIRYVCANRDGGDTYDSTPVLHPPPAVIIRPPDAGFRTTTVSPPRQQNAAPTVPVLGRVHEPQYGPGDRPPNYSEVVMSDFVDEQRKFPGVLPNTPPPKYEDGQLPRY